MRFIYTLFLSIIFHGSLFAQVSSGFYRVQNDQTSRYLYVHDDKGYARLNGANIETDLDAICLRAGLDYTISNPGSIIYFENKGGSYNFYSQGTNSFSIIQHYLTITERSGQYALGAEESGFKTYITDDAKGTSGYGKISNGKDGAKFWNVIPVSSSSDNYFGVAPSLQVGDKYYTSFYSSFAFSPVSSNTKSYYVKEFSDAAVLLEEISGTVGSQVPVVIESISSSASDNKFDLLESGPTPNGNKLSGVFFDTDTHDLDYYPKEHHINQKSVASTHRVISVSSSGKLVFAKPTTTTLPANSAYLEVSSTAKESLAVFFDKGEYDEYNASSLEKIENAVEASAVYNLLGKKVVNNGSLPAGIYIIGGKKTVIR